MTITPKKLVIENENNKLLQQQFIQIHFAPRRAGFNAAGVFVRGVIEDDFNQLFVINNSGTSIFVKITEFKRIKFGAICNYYTNLCSGVNAYWWKGAFKIRYPGTTDETEMAVYYYERVEV